MLSIVSPGLKSPNSVTFKACEADINWPLTKLSSTPNIWLYMFSIVSLPISSYPYPVVSLKWTSDRLLSWNAFKTFNELYSQISLILANSSFTSFSHLFTKLNVSSLIPYSLYIIYLFYFYFNLALYRYKLFHL